MKKNKKYFLILLIISFIVSVQTALPAYINSTFISGFIGEEFIGILYAIQSALVILALAFVSKVASKLGNYKFSLITSAVVLLSLMLLYLPFSTTVILFSFIVYMSSTRMLFLGLDFFLERASQDNTTGNTRGLYLTTINIAWVISPYLSGLIISKYGMEYVYLISSILSLSIIFLLFKYFRKIPKQKYQTLQIISTIKKVLRNKEIKPIFFIYALLTAFYSIMVIYTPIYLNKTIGLSWENIGIIFTIMLLAFILFEIPTGKIADKFLGEKELLVTGFIIISISTLSITFISSSSILIWASVLFLTRVGASIIEVLSDTYLFKKIDHEDTDIISLYRMVGPLSYILAPALATIILLFADTKYLFLILSIILLSGIIFSLQIKDTK